MLSPIYRCDLAADQKATAKSVFFFVLIILFISEVSVENTAVERDDELKCLLHIEFDALVLKYDTEASCFS